MSLKKRNFQSMSILINNKNYFLMFFILMALSSSCVSKYKINYFQTKNSNDSSVVLNKVHTYNYTPVFKQDDFIFIEVTGLDEVSIKPFILNSSNVNGNQSTSYDNGIAAKSGYLIDAEGNIELPFAGKIKLAGLNRMEATELIKSKLSDYISHPVINIRIQNFKVTVLGDVRNPGSFNIPNERITIPEILGIAGDLNITGLRNNILVIREENGQKTEYRVDLTSKDIFNSPVYYLSQNDIVYVEPNRAKRNSSLISSTAGVLISITSLIIATVNLVTK